MRVKANGWMLPLIVMRRRTGENQSLVSVGFLQVFVGMCVLDGGSGSLDPLSGRLVGGDFLTFGRFNKNSREIFNWKSPIHLKNLKTLCVGCFQAFVNELYNHYLSIFTLKINISKEVKYGQEDAVGEVVPSLKLKDGPSKWKIGRSRNFLLGPFLCSRANCLFLWGYTS